MDKMDILLVDDHTAAREELASIVEAQEEMNVVGQAGNGEDGVRLAAELHPDIVVMDVVMPGMNGLAASREINASSSQARILAVSNHTGENLVEALLEAGVSGYLRKDRAYEELVPAIRTIASGTQYIGEHL